MTDCSIADLGHLDSRALKRGQRRVGIKRWHAFSLVIEDMINRVERTNEYQAMSILYTVDYEDVCPRSNPPSSYPQMGISPMTPSVNLYPCRPPLVR